MTENGKKAKAPQETARSAVRGCPKWHTFSISKGFLELQANPIRWAAGVPHSGDMTLIPIKRKANS
jgi:hypothetical protein